MKQNQKDSLEWQITSLTHKKTQKKILNSMQGIIQSGDFLTIMGSSGAGKSSLLSLLTCRITKANRQYQFNGKLLLNDQPYNLTQFSKFAAYVRQDDILMSTLTVEETLQFQTEMKWSHLSSTFRKNLVDKTIIQLNLEQCRNSLIGDQLIKCISGGQKKRVAIGVELISNPKILILDEPTSGLDSFNALKMIKILKKMCSQGKIIITTIHQPSSLMYLEMDMLLLLSKGDVVFQGKANQIINYMENIGVVVNHKMNPADFFIWQISSYRSIKQKGYKTKMTAERWKIERLKPLKNQTEDNRKMITGEGSVVVSDQYKLRKSLSHYKKEQLSSQAGYSTQFKCLLGRSWKNSIRNPINLMTKPGDIVGSVLIIGVCFLNLGNEAPSLQNPQFVKLIEIFLRSFLGLVFISIFALFGANSYQTVMCFPPEKQLCLKETSSKIYSITVYYFSRLLVELPACIIQSTIIIILVYIMTGLQRTWSHFFIFGSAAMMAALVGYTMGSFIGIFFKKGAIAVQMMPIFTQPMILIGGQVCNLEDVPKWFQWFQYISPIRHCTRIILLDQLQSSTFQQYRKDPLFFGMIKEFLGVQGMSNQQFYEPYIWLIILLFGYMVLSIIVLHIRKEAL